MTARIVGTLENVLVALGSLPRPAVPFDRSIEKVPPGDVYEKTY